MCMPRPKGLGESNRFATAYSESSETTARLGKTLRDIQHIRFFCATFEDKFKVTQLSCLGLMSLEQVPPEY